MLMSVKQADTQDRLHAIYERALSAPAHIWDDEQERTADLNFLRENVKGRQKVAHNEVCLSAWDQWLKNRGH